jgi:hypothetical protein
MRPLVWIGRIAMVAFVGLACISGPVSAEGDNAAGSCGDEQASCGSGEHCCEHTVAMFSDAGSTAPTYKEGKCIAKEQKCADFWCGNRHCEAGFFGAPSVCCITSRPDLPPEYKCSYSELSCPGNSQLLTIRDKEVADARQSQTY